MNRLYTALFAFLIFMSPQAILADWGKTGHRATGEIASQYLSKKAQRAIDDLLNGASLALVSTYGDEIKSDPKYREFGPWHYVNYPFGADYQTSPKSDRGDIIVAIQKCVAVLKDKTSSKEDKAFYLKLLVHFLGDLHMPLHVGIADDLGANRFQVQWFDDGTNLHRVWDENLIEYYNMSYTELAQNAMRLSEAQLKMIQGGTVLDWMAESRELCEDVYENTKVGANLKYDYAYRYMDTVRSQLQKGGIRLAVLLNDIFG
ncbi:MAG: S1/P1 nuclease [Gilvibacter sp.]